MTKKATLRLVRTLDQTVERWVKVRREIEAKKAELAELEPPIKEALKRAPDRQRQFGPHLLFLTKDSFRSTFDRARAIAELGSEVVENLFKKTPVEGSIRVK